MLGFGRAVDHPRSGAVSQMRKTGFKALATMLMIGRRSKKHIDWTMVIAVFSTIVTISLIALYVFQDSAAF